MDQHSKTISNKPGTTVRIPRNSVSDDPREACHFGLHVGAKNYADSFKGYDGQLVVCKVDPEHVVCVPYDSRQEKMRTCEYQVIGVDGRTLPDTVYDEDEDKSSEPEEKVVEVVKTEKVESKEKGKPSATVVTRTKADRKVFDSLNKLDAGELLKKSIYELRLYATHGLEMVGASKIPGGKTALVKKIIKARG